MTKMERTIIIGTRASELAVWQANEVKRLFEEQGYAAELKKISTKGDEILDRSLLEVGGKGLFLKEIEEAMLRQEIDVAVHSMKDVPFELPEGLVIPCVLERASPWDALCTRGERLSELKPNAIIGTASDRRRLQLSENHPDFEFRLLRGNVNTRLKKLDEGEYDAIILACAGLERIGLSERITEKLDIIPAVTQGVIGVECREGDDELLELLKKLNHQETWECAELERAFLGQIEGDCHTPMGCHVQKVSDDSYQAKFFARKEGAKPVGPSEFSGTFQEMKSFFQSL
jgi:hydroxymethylbilane synthase